MRANAASLAAVDAETCARLLAWFAVEQRDLPWRESRDPYRVWISEAMLQQTRVDVVVPYYQRFLERFPNVEALASASVDDVLAHWSGLGYYRRARTLHAAAREIIARHGGVFPRSRAHLVELPGIGPYTAGAVASIAYDEVEPLVDGNVARVFARLFALDAAPESKAFRDSTWAIADRMVKASGSPGAWNQALMELGATLCTPRDPGCTRCPVQASCLALAEGRVAELPRPKVRRAQVDVELLVFVVREHGRILCEERPADGRMAGMWQVPTIEPSGAELVAPARLRSGLHLAEFEPLGELRHSITHHKIRARIVLGRLVQGAVRAPFAWLEPRELETRARTGLTKKIEARGWLASALER